jgi:hypothetical protein
MKWIIGVVMSIIYAEENRILIGKKIGSFLNKKLNIFLNYSKTLFNNELFGFFCCVSIVLLSLYKRSMIDIGQDSGLYLEIAQKILDGKKYYHDFFEYNFPLSFLLLTPPVYVANLLNVSPIIIADYFINLLGILSLIWAYKILKNRYCMAEVATSGGKSLIISIIIFYILIYWVPNFMYEIAYFFTNCFSV